MTYHLPPGVNPSLDSPTSWHLLLILPEEDHSGVLLRTKINSINLRVLQRRRFYCHFGALKAWKMISPLPLSTLPSLKAAPLPVWPWHACKRGSPSNGVVGGVGANKTLTLITLPNIFYSFVSHCGCVCGCDCIAWIIADWWQHWLGGGGGWHIVC